MYISTYLTLDTGLSGVEAAEEELDITGENIDNASTDDYEQQIVNLSESPALDIAGSDSDGAMQLGTGVDATGVVNSGDPYLDAAWRTQNAATQSASTTQTYMDQIDEALDEPSSDGISAQLEQFWTDWNTLSENPTGTASAAAQQAVVDDAEGLATSFNSLSSEINGSDPNNPTDPANESSILGQVNSQYQNIMAGPDGSGASGGEIYDDAYQISSLNEAIVQAQAAGQSANDLIDQRNAAIDDLSSLGSVSVTDNTDGSVTVNFGGVTSEALVSDPAGATANGTVPMGDNFGSYATSGGTAATGWVAAFQQQYSDAANGTGPYTSAQTASQLASTVGGTLGSLIGVAGYSADGFGDLGGPVTDTDGDTTYPDSADAGTPATQLGTIGEVNAQLNAAATTLMNEVNNPAVVTSGQTAELDDGDPPTSTGTSPNATTQNPDGTGSPAISLLADFFVMNTSSTSSNAAANLAVSSTLQTAAENGITPDTFTSSDSYPSSNTGVNNIQISTLGTSYEGNYSSDNDVALDEANNSGGAADQAYDSFVQTVGSLAEGADDADNTQSALQTQITDQRESVEGVDQDQEMANLISEQQSYEASAKVMDAFNTVMDSLMGVVGVSS